MNALAKTAEPDRGDGEASAESVAGDPRLSDARAFLGSLTTDAKLLDDISFLAKIARGLARARREGMDAERIRGALDKVE